MRPLLIVDLEATCWKERRYGPDDTEIIEIGALLADPPEGESPREHQTFVRPVRSPVLSEFCTELTGIRQQDVDAADPFPEAFARFVAWIGDARAVRFASWGAYDAQQIDRECRRHGIEYPFAPDHLDLKRTLSPLLGVKRAGMAAALKRAGLALEGSHHRALDDARNIWRLLRHLASQLPPELVG